MFEKRSVEDEHIKQLKNKNIIPSEDKTKTKNTIATKKGLIATIRASENDSEA